MYVYTKRGGSIAAYSFGVILQLFGLNYCTICSALKHCSRRLYWPGKSTAITGCFFL